MNRFLYVVSTLFFAMSILFANPVSVLANGEVGGHEGMEVEVNGFQVVLSNQNEWVKGENTVVVTLTDSMGIPVTNADAAILIAPKVEEHVEENSHADEQTHNSMPGMDMGEPEAESPAAPAHDEEAPEPAAMMESHDHGVYVLETHLEASGEHTVQVFFHVNGEMMQANFIVDVPGMASNNLIVWGFVLINVGLVVSAGVLKKQSLSLEGK